jgi:hypothetical protein
LIKWNQADFWPDLLDAPGDGGPVFFAETCFGDQLGFRVEKGEDDAVHFAVDTIELFVVADRFSDLFTTVLSEPHALVDARRLERLRSKLSPVPDGMHYSPIVSPLVGGSDKTSNFHFESPNVHLRSSLAVYQAVKHQEPED